MPLTAERQAQLDAAVATLEAQDQPLTHRALYRLAKGRHGDIAVYLRARPPAPGQAGAYYWSNATAMSTTGTLKC